MARKEITTPLDLKNMGNHNYNYDELYGLIDETDRRISEDMWEEIKKANTMTMLEPVQTSSELPSEAPDKSFITVIDEQRVYTYFQGKWQPFNEIDLDPFEPFKEELAAIVAAYEEQIKNITTEVQNTKASAIDSVQSTQTQSEASITQTKQSAIESIESTQTQSESNINQTEQSAVNSINQTQTDTESQISTIRAEMTTQASDLTALFNDHMAQLTSKQETALGEVDSAKQAAITEIEDFQSIDTSNWQKFKLTESNGDRISKSGVDVLSLESGFFEGANLSGVPHDEASRWFIDVYQVASQDAKTIKATLGYTGDTYQRTIYGESDSGWKKLTGMTKTVLFEGSASGVDSIISLSEPYDNFEYLFVSFGATPGKQTKIFEAQGSDWIAISVNNVYNDASNAKAYEMAIKKTDLTTLTITNEVSYSFDGSGSDDSSVVIEKIVGVK